MISITMVPRPFDLLPSEAITVADYVRGAAIFRQDDRTLGLYWVQSGAVDLQRFTEAGMQVLLHRAVAGETFAEASLFSRRYHCSAVAVENSRAALIDKSAVIAMVRADPEFALALLAQLAGQVQGYRRRLELLAIRSAGDRVLAALSDGAEYDTIMSLASQIGLTHEATYRALALLHAGGYVEKLGRGNYHVVRGAPKGA